MFEAGKVYAEVGGEMKQIGSISCPTIIPDVRDWNGDEVRTVPMEYHGTITFDALGESINNLRNAVRKWNEFFTKIEGHRIRTDYHRKHKRRRR